MKGIRNLLLTLCVTAGTTASLAESVNLQDRMQLADGLFRRNLFELAEKEYASLADLKNIEGMDNILFRLAECKRKRAKEEEAEVVYRLLVESFPNSRYIERARLQCALLQLNQGKNSDALLSLKPLVRENVQESVRMAALYHLGQAYEDLGRNEEALASYEVLRRDYPKSDYSRYAGLKSAWLLSQYQEKAKRNRALGIYLDLIHQKKDMKVAEEALYFSAKIALEDGRFDESARLFTDLQNRFPKSERLAASILSAAWANYYSGHYKEASSMLTASIQDPTFKSREKALYLKANCLRQLSLSDEAAEYYGKILKEFPTGELATKAWYESLTLLYRSGRYEKALKQAMEKLPPPEPYADQVYWIAADSALALDRGDLVVQNCKLLVEKCPQSPLVKDALYRLGLLLYNQKAWEAATTWFAKVPERFPKDPLAPKALYSMGVCHSRLNNHAEALRDWTLLLTRYPDSPEVSETLYQKAMEELGQKNYRAAAATLEELSRRFPKNAHQTELSFWRGAIYFQMDDFHEAEKSFRVSLASHPPKDIEHRVLLQLGLTLQKLKREKESAEIFNRLLDSSIAKELGEKTLEWLSLFQFNQKQFDSAKKAAQILIDLQSDKGWTQTGWTLLGKVHQVKNERDPAINAFKHALGTGARTDYAPEAALRLGELLSLSGHFEEADSFLQQAVELSSSPKMLALRARAYMGLAQNAERGGKDEQALRYYISVGILFDNPTLVPQALSKSVSLMEKLGRFAEAKAMREELVNRYPDSPYAQPPKEKGR